MTLIEALLSLPQRGAPMVAAQELATVLATGSARFVRRHATLWSLTDDGQRFLTQFRVGRTEAIDRVTVRLVSAADGAMFDMQCGAGSMQRLGRSELHRKLCELQKNNPDVTIVFDFRAPGGMS